MYLELIPAAALHDGEVARLHQVRRHVELDLRRGLDDVVHLLRQLFVRRRLFQLTAVLHQSSGHASRPRFPAAQTELTVIEGELDVPGGFCLLSGVQLAQAQIAWRLVQPVDTGAKDLPCIVIAAINGPAVGIGLEICTLCDLRFASDKAKLGEVAVPAGFLPESGGARNLPKLVGVGKALDMILTGKIIMADEALDIGLVEKVFPHDDLLPETIAYAAQIASNPYLSVRYAKDLVKMYWNDNRSDEGWAKEFAAIQEITRTGDCVEGIRAFLDKRKPEYKGPYYDNPPFGGPKGK